MLTIERAFHREEESESIRFRFNTAEKFIHFQYAIRIDVVQADQEIFFRLLGLGTQGIVLPGQGNAESVFDFFKLKGDYHIVVDKQRSRINDFILRITPKNIRLVQGIKQKSPFLSISIV